MKAALDVLNSALSSPLIYLAAATVCAIGGQKAEALCLLVLFELARINDGIRGK